MVNSYGIIVKEKSLMDVVSQMFEKFGESGNYKNNGIRVGRSDACL
jgi:hypothetical protein